MGNSDYPVIDVKGLYVDMEGSRIYEMLWGDNIHPGGVEETRILAQKAGINRETKLLDVCCGLGGPARYLARTYGCQVTGMDLLEYQCNQATRRSREEGLDHLIEIHQGNAMEMPFPNATFDVVWGQDAWCHVPDKGRLIAEAARVVKGGGLIAFTDHLATEQISDEMRELMNTLACPNLETLAGYRGLLEAQGFSVLSQEDIGAAMGEDYRLCAERVRGELKEAVIAQFGQEIFEGTCQMMQLLADGVAQGHLGRGRFIARKK